MKIRPEITIHQASELLRKALETQTGMEITGIDITSYDKFVVQIDLDCRSSDGQPTHMWSQSRELRHITVP